MIASIWILASILVALVFGSARKIGFRFSFLVCLLLTPVIGLIVIFTYPRKRFSDYERPWLM